MHKRIKLRWKRPVLICFAVLWGCIGCVKSDVIKPSRLATDYQISIIHMNDTHSHLDAEPMDMLLGGERIRVELGGIAKASTKIDQLRRQHKNHLMLHAGDAVSGTLYDTLFHGDADAQMLNQLKVDAFTIGNHEFDGGDAHLADFLKKLQMPVVSSNIQVKNGSPLDRLFTPYIVQEIGGEKIGIIGLVIKNKTERSSNPGKSVNLLDEVNSTKRAVKALQQQGVNKIILLSHYGYENEVALAGQVEGVDVIVGGDSHTLLGDFTAIGLKPAGPYPTRTTSYSGDPVCVVQAWQYGFAVGHLDVGFDSAGVVTFCEGEATLLIGDSFKRKNAQKKQVEISGSDRQVIYKQVEQLKGVDILTDDPAAIAVLSKYADKVDVLKKEIIGESKEDLIHVRIPKVQDGTTNVYKGSAIAPIVAKSFYEMNPGADIAVINAGGVRMSIKQGPITVNTAYTLLPFSNTLYDIEMTGRDVKSLLEDAVDTALIQKSTGAFPYAYGIRYDIATLLPKGERLSNVKVRNRKTGGWNALKPEKRYTVTTISYLANGKDGYKLFQDTLKKGGKGGDTYLSDAIAFVNYVKRRRNNGESIHALPNEDNPIQHYHTGK